MAKILALVDGSIYSQSVCDHAAWIARRTGAAVEILHVIGRRETASAPADLSGNITLGARTALLEELTALDEQRGKLAQKRGRAILEDAKARLEADGVSEVTTKLRIGDIVETVGGVRGRRGRRGDRQARRGRRLRQAASRLEPRAHRALLEEAGLRRLARLQADRALPRRL